MNSSPEVKGARCGDNTTAHPRFHNIESSPGGAMKQLIRDNKRTKPIDCCLVIYMFLKASSVFRWCMQLTLQYMSLTPYIPCLCALNIYLL